MTKHSKGRPVGAGMKPRETVVVSEQTAQLQPSEETALSTTEGHASGDLGCDKVHDPAVQNDPPLESQNSESDSLPVSDGVLEQIKAAMQASQTISSAPTMADRLMVTAKDLEDFKEMAASVNQLVPMFISGPEPNGDYTVAVTIPELYVEGVKLQAELDGKTMEEWCSGQFTAWIEAWWSGPVQAK